MFRGFDLFVLSNCSYLRLVLLLQNFPDYFAKLIPCHRLDYFVLIIFMLRKCTNVFSYSFMSKGCQYSVSSGPLTYESFLIHYAYVHKISILYRSTKNKYTHDSLILFRLMFSFSITIYIKFCNFCAW